MFVFCVCFAQGYNFFVSSCFFILGSNDIHDASLYHNVVLGDDVDNKNENDNKDENNKNLNLNLSLINRLTFVIFNDLCWYNYRSYSNRINSTRRTTRQMFSNLLKVYQLMWDFCMYTACFIYEHDDIVNMSYETLNGLFYTVQYFSFKNECCNFNYLQNFVYFGVTCGRTLLHRVTWDNMSNYDTILINDRCDCLKSNTKHKKHEKHNVYNTSDIIDDNCALDMFTLFLQVQSCRILSNNYHYFHALGEPLFKLLLNLVFNENDLYQKFVKKYINFVKHQLADVFLNTSILFPFLYAICKFDSNLMRIDNNNINSNSVFDQIISQISPGNYHNKNKEAFIHHILDNCKNLLNEIVYYRNANTGCNILSRIIDSKNMFLIKFAFQKLFHFQDVGINGVKTKISTTLEYKFGKKLTSNLLMFAAWQNEQVNNFVQSVYNASKNDEIVTLRSLLDLIVVNHHERAIEKLCVTSLSLTVVIGLFVFCCCSVVCCKRPKDSNENGKMVLNSIVDRACDSSVCKETVSDDMLILSWEYCILCEKESQFLSILNVVINNSLSCGLKSIY